MNLFKRGASSKHSKLGEGWDKHRDPYRDGVVFALKYLGTHLVEEPPPGKKYTDGRSSEAIKTIVGIKKKKNEKATKVDLFVKSTGITIFEQISRQMIDQAEIQRVSFCTSDRDYPRVFAYFARNTINETMQCHAFSCKTPVQASEVSHAVHQAFLLAQEELINHNQGQSSQEEGSSPTDNTQIDFDSHTSPKRNWINFDD